MRVILIKDVARLGRRSEVKEVPSGHALNFLIPRKLAIVATSTNMKRLEEEVKKRDTQAESSQKSFEEALLKLGNMNVVLQARANEKGHLFKGVGAHDIAEHLIANGFAITVDDIALPQPIKSIGVHEVNLMRGEIKGTCTLEVIKK